MADPKIRIIFLVGPTASGKTEAAIRLAKKINAEIISCDSMQIYRGMEVVTSKPKAEKTEKIPHHLMSIIAPAKDYNVSRYRKNAVQKIKEIIGRERIPLFVGGTGLYMSILIDGIFKSRAQDKDIRRRLYKEAQVKGSGHLYRKLKEADPQAAEKIHPNDLRRIVRALEVFEATGKAISSLQKERKGLGEEYDIRIFCLNMPRNELYARIEKRVDKMFSQGLMGEVKRLLKAKLSRTASYAIGIRELKGYFDGLYDLGEAKQLMKRNSRLYAKRQLTWFRKDKRIEWIDISQSDTPAKIAKRIWNELY